MSEFADYKIAGSVFRIHTSKQNLAPMVNLVPFEYDGDEKPLFSLCLDSVLPSAGKQLYSSDEYFFRICEAENGYIIEFNDIESPDKFGMYFDTSYSKFITDMEASDICTYVLNNMLMLSYTFATIDSGALMIHSSVAVVDGKAYMFLGKSGTGKSTHCRLWLKNIEGADILNDDNPVLKVEDDGVYVYGSAWSGKGCVYKNEGYRVGGIARLKQAPYNKIERKVGTPAFALLYTACSKLPWSSNFMDKICKVLSKIVAETPVYFLECLPDDEAARISYNTMK